MERDSITRAGAKGPWGREGEPPEQRHAKARIDLDSVPGLPPPWQRAEGGSKLWDGGGCMPGIGLRSWSCRKALLDMLALKPYRGKPAVRNFRGGDGNVGIIRSPLRATAPLDRPELARQVADRQPAFVVFPEQALGGGDRIPVRSGSRRVPTAGTEPVVRRRVVEEDRVG